MWSVSTSTLRRVLRFSRVDKKTQVQALDRTQPRCR